VSQLQAACKAERDRWHGLRLLAADKTTLTLPESKSLWKAFGGHKGCRSGPDMLFLLEIDKGEGGGSGLAQ